MRVRQSQNHGRARWVVDYKDGKGHRRRRFFALRDEAAQFSRTVTPGPKRAATQPSSTIRDLLNTYLEDTQVRRGAAAQSVICSRCRTVANTLKATGFMYAEDQGIEAFRVLVGSLRAAKLSEHTIQGYAAAYRAALRWAIAGGILPQLPMSAMRLPDAHHLPKRHLSQAEIRQLAGRLAGTALDLPATLGIYQGLRRGEACRLRVGDLDLSSNRLTVTESKTRRWRTIQMHDKLRARLPQPLPARDFLCLNTKGGPCKPQWLTHAFRDIVDELGPDWRNVTFHTLRHTCASQMAASGKYTLYQIARFLGHRSIQTTQKYAHLLPDQLKPDW